MSEPNDDRPATRDDVIYAVLVLALLMMLCNLTHSCNRKMEMDRLRESFQQRK